MSKDNIIIIAAYPSVELGTNNFDAFVRDIHSFLIVK